MLHKRFGFFLALIFAAFQANAEVGTELDRFTPSPGGNGRGITVKPGTATTAYYSTYGSEDRIYIVDLKSHGAIGTLDTNLESIEPGGEFRRPRLGQYK